MKLFILAILTFAVTAHAADNVEYAHTMKIDRDYLEVYAVEAELVDAGISVPRCPPRAMCDPQGTVTLSFRLNGCSDELGPVSVRLERNGGKYDLYVNALAFTHERSTRTDCRNAPVETVTVPAGKMGGLSKSIIGRVISASGFYLKK